MYWFMIKEILVEFRYKMMMFNLWVNPFFMIAPYIILANDYGLSARILESMLLWSWLCQFLFGISNSINVLRWEGTFANVLMAPCSFIRYEFMIYLYLVLDNTVMTLVTVFLSKLILNVTVVNPLQFFMLVYITSLSLFCFSVGYTYAVLRFKKISSINSLLQHIFGFLSGYTSSINRYPPVLRFVSYCIPLTYAVLISENDLKISPVLCLVWTLVSLAYLIVGKILLDRGITLIKRRGEVEQW